MNIFIDESGTFAAASVPHSISIVGALIIPDGRLDLVLRAYAEIRPGLPTENGEVKGRLLSESEVDCVVSMLIDAEAVFEATAIDMGVHTIADIASHKQSQEHALTANLTDSIHSVVQNEVWQLRHRLEQMPFQLYVQSVATFDLIERVFQHGTMYYSQRRPEELAAFRWIIDGKDQNRITDWEQWWSFVVMPILQTKSFRKPFGIFPGGDYSHFERFHAKISDHLKPYMKDPSKDEGVNLRTVLTEDFRFSPDPEPGLEMVDILTNATRRAMSNKLRLLGWQNIPRLMIHRSRHYIQMIAMTYSNPSDRDYPYDAVLQHFSRQGRVMAAAPHARRS